MASPRWLLGFLLLASPLSQTLSTQTEADVNASLKKFTQVYEAVESNFADKLDADNTVFKGAIPHMLRTLDPHSNFFDPKAYELMREGQSGHYFGVGMYVGSPEGHVIVMYPFQNSPAYRAGLRPGDQIISVDDSNTERSTVAQVSAMLKGPKGTPVTITVRRAGREEAMHFSLVRDNVPRGSVNYAFWLRPGIAYMMFNRHKLFSDVSKNRIIMKKRSILRKKRLRHIKPIKPHLFCIFLLMPETALTGPRLFLQLLTQMPSRLIILLLPRHLI